MPFVDDDLAIVLLIWSFFLMAGGVVNGFYPEVWKRSLDNRFHRAFLAYQIYTPGVARFFGIIALVVGVLLCIFAAVSLVLAS